MVPTYCMPIDQETTYTFTVRARDIDGNLSPMSDPLFVTTAARQSQRSHAADPARERHRGEHWRVPPRAMGSVDR